MSKKSYEECQHNWTFQIDAAKSGFPENKPWASFVVCQKCSTVINFLEKCALDQLSANE